MKKATMKTKAADSKSVKKVDAKASKNKSANRKSTTDSGASSSKGVDKSTKKNIKVEANQNPKVDNEPSLKLAKNPGKQKKVKMPKKVDKVRDALKSVENVFGHSGYQIDSLDMLQNYIHPCLARGVDERNSFQKTGVDMLDKAMLTIKKQLEEKLEDAEGFLQDANGIKLGYEAKVSELTLQEQQLEEVKQATKASLDQHEDAVDRAQKELVSACDEQKRVLIGAQTDKENLEYVKDVLDNHYERMMNDPPSKPQELAKLMKVITNCVQKQLDVEDTMACALPPALKKKIADRGQFDNVTVDTVYKAFKAYLNRVQMLIESQGDREQASESKVLECQKTLDDAKEACQVASEKHFQILKQIKNVQDQIGEQRKLLRAHPARLQNGQKDQDNAKAQLDAFEGILKQFQWLQQRNSSDNGEDDQNSNSQMDVDIQAGSGSGLKDDDLSDQQSFGDFKQGLDSVGEDQNMPDIDEDEL